MPNIGNGGQSAQDMQATPQQTVRHWTDVSGKRQAEATLLAANEQKARLEKRSGKIVTVALASLSAVDRKFIRSQITAADTARKGDSVKSQSAEPNLTKLLGMPALAAVPSMLNRMSGTIPPNAIYVRISQPYLNRYVKHRVFKRAAVNDCILGTPVQGTSQTTGHTDLTLIPDPQRARMEVRLSGVADISTVGTHDPVWIYTHSLTGFRSAKHILVDNRGIAPSPARTNARTRSTTTGISTSLGPILGRIALRVAWQRVNESRAAADCISADHTARRVNRELDLATSDAVAQIRAAMTLVKSSLEDHRIKQPRLLASTTSDYLQIILLSDDADERNVASFVEAPAADPDRPDVELMIHSAVVFAALKDSDVRATFQPVMTSAWYQSLLKFSAAALGPTDQDPHAGYSMKWSESGEWLTLKWNARGGAKQEKESIAKVDGK
jgi:hypothetical protein